MEKALLEHPIKSWINLGDEVDPVWWTLRCSPTNPVRFNSGDAPMVVKSVMGRVGWFGSQFWYWLASWWLWSRPCSRAEMRLGCIASRCAEKEKR